MAIEFRIWAQAHDEGRETVTVTRREWVRLSGPWGPSWVNVAEQRIELGRGRFVPIVIVADSTE